jgi:hypothetical protein
MAPTNSGYSVKVNRGSGSSLKNNLIIPVIMCGSSISSMSTTSPKGKVREGRVERGEGRGERGEGEGRGERGEGRGEERRGEERRGEERRGEERRGEEARTFIQRSSNLVEFVLICGNSKKTLGLQPFLFETS